MSEPGWTRCPACNKPVSWAPRPDGVRVLITLKASFWGDYYLNERGVLLEVPEKLPYDIPRYDLHVNCQEWM